MTYRIAIIGDIGGHADELYAALVGLGMEPDTWTLPEDLIVIQVGDLIHRGPDSTGVLDIVDRFIRSKQWVQLIGNHEANEWFEQFMFETVSDDDFERITHWFDCGYLHVAAAVETTSGDILVTHAGLTKRWYEKLGNGKPLTASDITYKLNHMIDEGDTGWHQLLATGTMMGGPKYYGAGPIWAHAGFETCESWMVPPFVPMPFHQAHGHTTVMWYSKKSWNCEKVVKDATTVNWDARITTTEVQPGRFIYGVDPGLGKYAGFKWEPLVVEGKLLVV